MNLEQIYNIFPDADPMIREWSMVSSCYAVLFITAGYLYFIYVIGPRYMKDRPPYQLKNFIYFYNIFQILANAWIIKEFVQTGWLMKYGIYCSPPDFDSPVAQKVIATSYWLYQLKIVDYIETCIFVLRKKERQISGLHVYHHVSVVTMFWIYLRFYLDARVAPIMMLNCSIHVIMYTYYFCASCGPKIQRIIAPVKPYLTIMQMIQFVMVLVYLMQAFLPNCEVPTGTQLLLCFSINLIIYLILFYNFYTKNYKTSKQKV